MLKCRENPQIPESFIKNGPKRIEKHWSYKTLSQQFLNILPSKHWSQNVL